MLWTNEWSLSKSAYQVAFGGDSWHSDKGWTTYVAQPSQRLQRRKEMFTAHATYCLLKKFELKVCIEDSLWENK